MEESVLFNRVNIVDSLNSVNRLGSVNRLNIVNRLERFDNEIKRKPLGFVHPLDSRKAEESRLIWLDQQLVWFHFERTQTLVGTLYQKVSARVSIRRSLRESLY